MSAGGLLYHARAWARRDSHWRPFSSWVERRLSIWAPRSPELIVFGPSAGYTLPNEWFGNFDRVVFVEPDPLARLLLRRKLARGPRFDFLRAPDALLSLARDADPAALARALGDRPDAAVLFSNVLGQLPFLSKSVADGWTDALEAALRGRAWATYHDLFSTRALSRPRSAPGRSDRERSAPELAAPASQQDWISFAEREWPGEALTLRDHGTAALTAGRPAPAAWWEIASDEWHLIAWRSESR